MNPDSPIVEEVRRRAASLSARYGDDLRRYAEHLRDVEAANRARVVDQVTVVRSEPDQRDRKPAA